MKILISAWAARLYSPAPSAFVLRKWCRNGEIYPPPEKVGRDWFVDEAARRITGTEPVRGGLVAQMQNQGA
jgi:predicted site-specific integrase-resolvase